LLAIYVAVFFALFFIVLPFIYFRLVWFEARVIIKIKTKCFIFCLLLLADRISKQAEILFKVARNNNNNNSEAIATPIAKSNHFHCQARLRSVGERGGCSQGGGLEIAGNCKPNPIRSTPSLSFYLSNGCHFNCCFWPYFAWSPGPYLNPALTQWHLQRSRSRGICIYIYSILSCRYERERTELEPKLSEAKREHDLLERSLKEV